jgi:GNAT superfamily N-acetyltransferase
MTKGLLVAPLFAALDVLGPVGRVLRRPFADIPEDLILRALRARTLPRQIGAVVAGGALEEGIAEMGQEMLVDWGNGELDWTTEGITGYLEAAAIGALVGGPMTAAFEAPALVVQTRRNRDAQSDGVTNNVLQRIQDQAGNIRLRERSPEKWREFLQAIGTDQGRMYIEGDALQAAVTEGTVDAGLLGVTPEQIQTAIDTGGRVQISQTDWAANYAGTEVGQTVLENSAARADGYTPAQLRNFEDLVAQTDAESTFTTEQTAELDRRTDALRNERRLAMRGEGMSQAEAKANATLQAAAIRTLASRTGDMAVFDQFQLNIEGTSTLGRQRAADAVARVLDQQPTMGSAAEVSAVGVDASVSETDGMVTLNSVQARERGEGAGTQYMEALIRYADSVGKPIALTPSNSLGGSVARLRRFYAGFGFVPNKGRNKDFTTQEAMVRQPATPASSQPATGATGGFSVLRQSANRRTPSTQGGVTGVEMPTSLAAASQIALDEQFATGRDFKIDLQERARAVHGDSLMALNDENMAKIADFIFEDAMEAVQDNGNAIGWYDDAVSRAKTALAEIYPEIAEGGEAEFAFIWALAVTSNGLKVNDNFKLAAKAYDAWKETGAFPAKIGTGTAAGQIDGGLKMYTTLVEQFGGWEAARDFMVSQQKVRDIEKSTGIPISGEGKNETIRGAGILGPKIGNGFFSNLYGHFDGLTMDRWLMRSVGRWRGSLVSINADMIVQKLGEMKAVMAALDTKSINAFKAVVRAGLSGPQQEIFDGIKIGKRMSSSDMQTFGLLIQKASIAPAWRNEANAMAGGADMRKLGNALTKYLDGQVEAPAGAAERSFLRGAFTQALEALQQQVGMEALTMADLQALLWYPEKLLYDSAKKPAGEEIKSYADDEAPDYGNAAEALVRDRLGRDRAAGTGGRAGEQPSPAGAELGASGRTLNQSATDTAEFRQWAGTDEVLDPDEVNFADFSGSGPFVMRAYHGTTHTFEEFNSKLKGNSEGHFGAINYFTTSEADADGNYGASGPDLTSRIEGMQERAENDLEGVLEGLTDEDAIIEAAEDWVAENYPDFDTGSLDSPTQDDINEALDGNPLPVAQYYAQRVSSELRGGEEQVLEVFVRTDKPFVVGGDGSPFIEFVDFEDLQRRAVEQVADDAGVTTAEVEADPDTYEDLIDEARYDLEADEENALISAVQEVAGRYDADPSDILAGLHELSMEGGSHTALEAALRESLNAAYIEDPETGGIMSSQALSEVIELLGFDSIIMRNADQQFRNMNIDSGTAHVHVFDQYNTNIKSVDNVGTFDANDPRILNQEGARGQINLPENVRTGESLIQLFEGKDESTMVHEFGHYLIEVMRSIGETDGAPQQITEDLATVHAWMEETTGEAVDGDYSTPQQEAWAEAFENYLMSGVAPSPSLKVIFRKFALWLATVYKTAVGAGTQPSPEIREVMDRLLATDQEIAAVQLENNDGAMFGDKPPFMSADEWETYRKVAERGDAEAQGKMLNRAMESVRKKQTKEWKAFYAEALVAATEDLSNEREYVLIAALGDKDNDFGRGARLDRDTLVSMFGTAILDDLKALKAPQLIYVKDGADIDQVADMFGFRNGAHMVQTLRTVKPLAEQAAANARAVADTQAPALTPAEMQEEAEASLKNPTRIERVAREGAALSKASGGVISSWTVMNRAAKARAERLVGEMNVRQAGNYRQFAVAARKAAREAQAQLSKVVRLADGTPTAGGVPAMRKAAEAKRQQLLNDHMYNTARERAKAFDKARRRFAKTDTKKGRAKVDPDYMDQADALLSQYDFRQRTTAQIAENTTARKSLAEFILQQQEAGVDGELAIAPQVLLRGNAPLNYTELTVDELEAVVDAVDNLVHAGKAVQKSYLENTTLMYGEMVSEITTNMSVKMKATPRPDRESGQRSRVPKFLGALNHNIETALTTIRRMDGWEDNGPAMRFIFRPLQRAAAAVEERREQETVALKELYNRHYTTKEIRQLNDKRKNGIYIPELGDTFSKAGILSMALNSGNEGNFQRLTDVEGVTGNGAYDASRVNFALTEHMTETDWRFVQDMWDHIGSFWPEISALEREVSGVVPKQVDGIVQVDAPDFVTGGYYPISYDADLNIASFLSGADDAYKDATGGRSGKAQTRSGHVEARLRSTGMALDLNLGVAENHIMKVTHDLAMRKPINHAVKMLNNPAIGQALNSFGRTSDLQSLRSWLVDSAAGDSISADSMGGVMRYARKALTVKYIGFSLATLMLQPLGAVQAGVVVGNRNLASGYVKYAGRAEYWNNFIQTNSAHMRLRVRAVNREMNEFSREARTAETAGAGALTRWSNAVTSASLAPIGHVQYWSVDIPVFIAAFEKARGEGVAEADAISLAENAVDRASGSGSFLNRASFERGTSSDSARRTEYIKTFTMLASYVHSKYNAYVEVKGRTDFSSPLDTIKFTFSMMQLFVWEAAIVALYRSMGEERDEEEGTGKWLASLIGSEVLGLHPVTRPLSSYVSGYGTGTVPLGDFAEILARGGSGAIDIATGEGEINDWLDVFDASATPFMLPTGQMKKIIKAITADEPAAQLGRVAMGLTPLRE